MEIDYCVEKEENLNKLYKLRRRIFVNEQQLSTDVIKSQFDLKAHHLVAKFNDEIIGAASIVETSPKHYKLERICVDKNYRGAKIGTNLVEKSIEWIKKSGGDFIELTAQSHLVDFYKKLGFEICDDKVIMFYGKAHIKMDMKGMES